MTQSTPTGAQYHATFGESRGGVADRARSARVAEERDRLIKQEFKPATVYNLHSFPLSVNLGDLGVIEVPAAEGEVAGRLCIENFRFSMRDMGDATFSPMGILPVELGKEVMREYGPTGGVVVVEGTRELSEAEVQQAQAAQRAWWRSEYQKAVDAWTRYRQHKMITDRQREAARMLHQRGEVAVLPEWVTISREHSGMKDCGQCGESVKAAARICRYCHSQFTEAVAAAPASHAETTAADGADDATPAEPQPED